MTIGGITDGKEESVKDNIVWERKKNGDAGFFENDNYGTMENL